MTNQHKPLTAAEIEELRELEAKATPGKWVAELDGHESSIRRKDDDCLFAVDLQECDAALISTMRNALPRLLSMLTPPADAELREAVEFAEDLKWWPEHAFRHIRTLLRAVQVPPVWRGGTPPHPWDKEWFIAETTYGDRVVLRALPEEYTYDFRTADETHIKADKIKRWMQFPDSNYIPCDAVQAPRKEYDGPGEETSPYEVGFEERCAVQASRLTGGDGCPDDIRALGWAVAVHNDYKLNGVKHTFWLFTKGDRNVKGEGLTDADALNEVRRAIAAFPELVEG